MNALTAASGSPTQAHAPLGPVPEVVLVSGISGSGKSVTMNALEDAGYFCVDNLPPELLRDLLAVERGRLVRRVAVALDVRTTGSPAMLVDLIAELRGEGVVIRTIFLEASTETLVRRFSESRRPHPLSGEACLASPQAPEIPAPPLLQAEDVLQRRVLPEAIALERELLAELRNLATVLDTSHLKPAQLRAWLRDLLGIPHGRLTLIFESFAYKHGVPLDADLVFDVRVLPNPHYERELRPLTGRDSDVMHYLQNQPDAQEMVGHIESFIRRWLPGFQDDQRSSLTVAIGCTGGQHRSVYVAERLARTFTSQLPTLLRHRELDGGTVA